MKTVIAFFRLIRIVNLLIIALCIGLFYYLIMVPVHNNTLMTTFVPLNHLDFVVFTLSVMFVAAGGNIINDYFDFELDKEFKPNRPLAQGAFSLNTAIYLHGFFIFAGIAMGFYLGWGYGKFSFGYLYVVAALLLYVYSAYLKKMPLAGNLVISGLTGFVFVLLLIYEAIFLNAIHAGNIFENTGYAFNIILLQAKFYAAFAFITNLAREIVKDLEDMDGDAAFNINTLAVSYGEKTAKFVAALVLLILIGGLAFVMQRFYIAGATKQILYFALLVQVPALVALGLLMRAGSKSDYHKISLLLKVIMLMGVLSIPAFYLFSHLNAHP